MRSCDFTKYPKLFGPTYWGSYNKLYEHDYENETIIGCNRNFIAESYNLKSNYNPTYNMRNIIDKRAEVIYMNMDIRDHIEYYKNYDKQIISIFSTDNINNDIEENIINKGYILVKPLYSLNQKSYIKIL